GVGPLGPVLAVAAVARRGGPAGPAGSRRDPGDLAGALVDDRAGHGDVFEQFGACLLGPAGQRLVQVVAGPDQPVAGVAGQLGPGQFQPPARADDAQALVPHPAVLLADI